MPKKSETRVESIREVFRQMGGESTLRAISHECYLAGVWDDEPTESQAIGRVRRALKASDESGLPFALPLPRGARSQG